jgi:hypothetical protein
MDRPLEKLILGFNAACNMGERQEVFYRTFGP